MRQLLAVPRGFLAPLCVTLFVSPAYLATASAAVTDDENAVVVSASRLAQPASAVGSSVVVLSADELLERDIRFVADALQEVPSLLVSSQGPRGSKSQVRVRGNEANHVLVLIDGVRVSNAADGEYDLANLSLDNIEKIEVLLGPQSTLYGSDAAAGVISIITRRGEGDASGAVRLSQGSARSDSFGLRVGGANEHWHYAVSASHYATEGISAAARDNGNTEKDGYDHQAVSVKTGYRNEGVDSQVVVDKSRSRVEYDGSDFGTGLAIDDPTATQWIDTRIISWVNSVSSLDEKLHHQLRFDIANYDYESFSGFTYLAKTERETMGYQGDYVFNPQHTVSFGVEKITDKLEAESLFVNHEVAVKGLYTQWLGHFGDTDITVGARQDTHEEYGQFATQRVTASHHLNDQWRMRAAYGTGFKAPGLLDLYMPSAWGGNPDLDPETSSNLEVGIEYRTARYHGSLTVFHQKTDDLIRAVSFVFENVDQATSQGAELALGADFDRVELNAAITWLDASEKQDGETSDRLRVPDWAANLTASYFYNAGRIWTQATYRGDRRDLNFATSEDVTLTAYWLVNAGISYRLVDDVTLSARVDNLANKDYEEVFSYGTPGRTGNITLDWRF